MPATRRATTRKVNDACEALSVATVRSMSAGASGAGWLLSVEVLVHVQARPRSTQSKEPALVAKKLSVMAPCTRSRRRSGGDWVSTIVVPPGSGA